MSDGEADAPASALVADEAEEIVELEEEAAGEPDAAAAEESDAESAEADDEQAAAAIETADAEDGGGLAWVAPVGGATVALVGGAFDASPVERSMIASTAMSSRGRVRVLLVALVALVPLAIGAFAPMAAAHTTEQPYVYAFVAPDSVDGRLELAIGDVETALGFDLDATDVEIEARLRENADALRSYSAEHFTVGAEGVEWPITFGNVDLFREGPGDLAFAVVQYDVAVPPEGVDAQIDIRFDPFFDEVPGRDGLLLIAGAFEGGEYVRDKEVLVTYTSDTRSQVVDLGARGQWQNFTSSITLGIDHIKTGADHILFVLALLLPSVLVFRDGWAPVAGFGSALWRVLKIATFFTIAHSITFTLAGMGWLPTPPSKVVETIIAGSIAAAALHNLKPIFPNREWSLSFVFGLFHGMGFASLVSDLDISTSSQLVSLLGRNVGIEIGQVVVILLLFPALFLLRRTPAYYPVLVLSSLALAAFAIFWMIERVFEIDLGTDPLVESVVSVPRGYVLAAAFTAVAAATYFWSRNSDRLIAEAVAPDAVMTAAPQS